MQSFNLNDSERKLLFIMISTPPEIKFLKNEFTSSLNIRKQLDYIYKTENLIRPYYADEHKGIVIGFYIDENNPYLNLMIGIMKVNTDLY